MRSRTTHSLDQSPLFKLQTKRRLAQILMLSPVSLKRLAGQCDRLYAEFTTKKKGSAKKREVQSPFTELKKVQARLADLLGRITPPNYLFCPVKGRSYVDNAAQHRMNRVVRCLDIRKFFPSTPSRRVFWFFKNVMQCSDDVAAILAKLATFRGMLPTGSPLSPIMAHYAYVDLWQNIAALSLNHGCTVTVYIDDVTVSGERVPDSLIWKIKKLIAQVGLIYHKEKKYVDRPAEVTGVVIRTGQLVAPNRQLKKLREGREALLTAVDPVEATRLEGRTVGLRGQLSQIARSNSL